MPAISRPILIALIAAVVALVGFYATQGSREASSGGAAEVAPPPPADPQPEAVAAKPNGAAPPDGKAADAARADAAKPPARAAQRAPAGSGAARKAAAAKAAARRRARAAETGVPVAVAQALAARKTVVLFFRGSGSADDHATARAVEALRGERGVVIFSDRIGRLGRYRGVVGALGVSQAPAVVVVDRDRSARVVQGYVDPATLAQDVADSR